MDMQKVNFRTVKARIVIPSDTIIYSDKKTLEPRQHLKRV